MMDHTILMIEGNPVLLRTNREALTLAGYRVLEADTLEKGREIVRQERPERILLDILLPDGNGLDYCRDMLGPHSPQILFLSCLDTKEDVIAGLRSGGDDYMTKPYLMEELLARVEALLRRKDKSIQGSLCAGRLELDITSGRAYLDGADLLLTPREFALLDLLFRNQGQYLSPKELYERVWGMSAVDTRPVKQHIRNIRDKLGHTPFRIESKRGTGHRLEENSVENRKDDTGRRS